MEKNNLPQNLETVEQPNETEKGFNAYMKIYDDYKLITEVCGLFSGDVNYLTDKDIYEIKTFLLVQSGILRSAIGHTVFEILSDEDDRYLFDYYGEDDDEEGGE